MWPIKLHLYIQSVPKKMFHFFMFCPKIFFWLKMEINGPKMVPIVIFARWIRFFNQIFIFSYRVSHNCPWMWLFITAIVTLGNGFNEFSQSEKIKKSDQIVPGVSLALSNKCFNVVLACDCSSQPFRHM